MLDEIVMLVMRALDEHRLAKPRATGLMQYEFELRGVPDSYLGTIMFNYTEVMINRWDYKIGYQRAHIPYCDPEFLEKVLGCYK